jgi:uncharacterized protein
MTAIARRTVLKSAAAAFGLLAFAHASAPDAALAKQGSDLRFEIYKDSRGGFRWRLKASNGRVIGTSGEGYKAKADCRNAIALIQRSASTASVKDLS